MRDVILHAFNWNYATIAARAKQIAQAGYGAVLFPPILYSKDDGSDWWQRYQPKDYRILRSYLGRKADLDGALKALQDRGLAVAYHLDLGPAPGPLSLPDQPVRDERPGRHVHLRHPAAPGTDVVVRGDVKTRGDPGTRAAFDCLTCPQALVCG